MSGVSRIPEPEGTTPPPIVVTRGGRPDDAALAAVVVALTPQPAPAAPAGIPAWRHAAMLEGVGNPAVLAPSDLEIAARGRTSGS